MNMVYASLYLYVPQFLSSVLYSFPSTGLLTPWLNVFLGILFCCCCYDKWDFFLSFSLIVHCWCTDTDLGPQDLLLRFQYSNTHTHGLQRSCGGKGTVRPLSQEESTSQRLGHSLKGGGPRALG